MTGSGQGSGRTGPVAKLSGALGALLVVGALGASGASATVTPISSGAVDWGVKETLRRYIAGPIANGSTSVAGGVTVNGDGSFHFPVTGGSYDSDTRSTVVELGGSVRFSGHSGELDIEIAQPRVEITATGAGIFADVSSRKLGRTVTIAYPDVELGSFDLDGITPASAGGHVTWSALPTTLTTAAVPAFADFCTAGQALDPLTLDYAGPGGAPLPESWTRPGQMLLRTIGETELDGAVEGLAVDFSHATLQVLEHVASPQSFNLLPLDFRTLASKGSALQVGTSAGRLYPGLARYGDGTVFAGGSDGGVTTLRAIGWDGSSYSPSASVADEIPAVGVWDGGDTFVGIDDDVLTVGPDGSGGWTAGHTPRDFSRPTGLAKSGSGALLAAGALPAGSSGAAPLTLLDTSGTPVTATAIPGTTLSTGSGYSHIAASLGLSAWAVEGDSPGRVVKLVSSGPLGVSLAPGQPAIEVGLDGTLYAAGTVGGRETLRALRDRGVTPSVKQQPDDAVARVLAAGDRAPASFTAVGFSSETKQPPAVRWQSRALGSLSWTDLGDGAESGGMGATTSTLTVSAGVADAGTRFRAIVSTDLGEIATRAATLSVQVGEEEENVDTGPDLDPDPVRPHDREPEAAWKLPPPVDVRAAVQAISKPAALSLSRLSVSGTRVSLRVSGPATVRVAIARRTVLEQRVHGKLRTRVRWVSAGTLSVRARAAGSVSATLPRLPAGRYRVTAQASSKAGRSAPLTRTLVVRKASPRR